MGYFTFTLDSSLSLLTLEQLHWFVPINALCSLRLFPPEAFLIHYISRSPSVFRQLHCKSLIQVKHNILLNLDLDGNRHKCKVDAKCCLAWMFCAEPCTKHWAGRPGPCSWVNADRDSFELADYSGKKSSCLLYRPNPLWFPAARARSPITATPGQALHQPAACPLR